MHIVLDARMVNMSGIGRYVRMLIELITATPHRLTLLGNPGELARWKGAAIIACHSKPYSPREQLELFLKVPPCDIFWAPHFNAPLLPIRARRRVTTIHDVFHLTPLAELHPLKKLYARLLLRGAVMLSGDIVTISDFTLSEMLSYKVMKPREKARTRIIYHSVNPFFLTPDNNPKPALAEAGPYMLFVGNVKPHKNIIGLLRAFSIIRQTNPRLRLLITGQKDNFITGLTGLTELMNELGITSHVEFTGYLDDNTLKSLYTHARLFIQPSFYEGFGWPPLEAMACGTPTAVSDIPVLKEIYGGSTVYFNPASPEDMATCATRVLNDENLRKELIEKGKALQNTYTPEKIQAQYLDFLNKLEVKISK